MIESQTVWQMRAVEWFVREELSPATQVMDKIGRRLENQASFQRLSTVKSTISYHKLESDCFQLENAQQIQTSLTIYDIYFDWPFPFHLAKLGHAFTLIPLLTTQSYTSKLTMRRRKKKSNFSEN